MHVDSRANLGEAPSGTGMIEMNVTEKNVPDVTGRKANPPQLGYNVVEG